MRLYLMFVTTGCVISDKTEMAKEKECERFFFVFKSTCMFHRKFFACQSLSYALARKGASVSPTRTIFPLTRSQFILKKDQCAEVD